MGGEWHGKAKAPASGSDSITRADAEILFAQIVETGLFGCPNGVLTQIPGAKALWAHLGAVRPDILPGSLYEYVSLATPSEGYAVVNNSEVWDVMEKAIKDIGAKIVTAGTLQEFKKFFISVDIGGHIAPRGDKFQNYLNFATSHDGTIAVTGWDSMTRIVCMNTLRASLAGKASKKFRVYHTKNAVLEIANLGDLINETLTQRQEIAANFERLMDLPCTAIQAHDFALGFLTEGKEGASTQAINGADEIATLFSRGHGNNGQTRYDLLNGVTEYYSSGSGVGKKSTGAERAYKGQFGQAAARKEHVYELLTTLETGEELFARMLEQGRRAAMDYAQSKTVAQVVASLPATDFAALLEKAALAVASA